jgi:choice-of-anchor B domain-containing protein
VTGERVPCTEGEARQYSCESVDLLSYLPIDQIGGERNARLNDIWGWTDPQTGREYALVGRTDGIAFVDITAPTEPVYLGELPTQSIPSTWRDVKVYENHAYVVSEARDHGLQVFDLTQLRSVSEPPVTFSETAHYDRFSRAHNVAINEESGYAYVVGITGGQTVPRSATCGAGLHIVNLSDPDHPEFAGCHNDRSIGGLIAEGYVHDAQCVNYQGPDPDFRGREICFNAGESQVNISDVTDKDDPETVTNATYPNSEYVHQAWLTEDRRHLLVDDELDEARTNNGIERTRTLVFDVSDLDNPTLVKEFLGETAAADHNQYVRGGYSYQANYTGGLRILDVSDPEAPSEVGHFDTYPSSNFPSFDGAWSTYPFFDSGVVVVSSIAEGLFVLQPTVTTILSFRAEVEGRRAVLRWRLLPSANTRRLVVEHRLPGAQEWQPRTTLGREAETKSNLREYEAANLQPGLHQFRIRHESGEGKTETSNAVQVRVLPDDPFTLRGLPNPIRGRETFTLILREARTVDIDLYDVLGRQVASLYEGEIRAGERKRLTIAPPSSGVYFLRMHTDVRQLTRKVVVAR